MRENSSDFFSTLYWPTFLSIPIHWVAHAVTSLTYIGLQASFKSLYSPSNVRTEPAYIDLLIPAYIISSVLVCDKYQHHDSSYSSTVQYSTAKYRYCHTTYWSTILLLFYKSQMPEKFFLQGSSLCDSLYQEQAFPVVTYFFNFIAMNVPGSTLN